MDPSTSTLVPTLTLLLAVQAALRALPLDALRSGPAFTEVRLYAHENLVAAFNDLLIFDDRVCLIVPTATSDESDESSPVFTSKQHTEFVLLICDRVYGGQLDAEALLGNADTPGMIVLADLVKRSLAGQSLDLPTVCLTPRGGQPFRVSTAERAQLGEGREAWAQTFSTPTGDIRVDRGRRGNRRLGNS